MDLGRSQDKFYVGRRFLESLEEGVKSSFREHMYLIDDVYFIGSLIGLELSLFDHLSDIIDSSIGCRIDLDHIEHTSPRKCFTVYTCPTRITLLCESYTVERFGKDAGD